MFISFLAISTLSLFLQTSSGLVSQTMTYSEENITSRAFPTLTYAFHFPQINDFYYLSYTDTSNNNTYNLLSIKYDEGIVDNVLSSKFVFAIYEQTNLQYSVSIETQYNSRGYTFDSLYDHHFIHTISLPIGTDFLMTINFVLYSQLAYDNAVGNNESSQAYQTGYEKGKNDGYDEGHSIGYDEGKDVGIDEGYDSGFADGEQSTTAYGNGYRDGYNNGLSHSTADFGFMNLFTGIADTPILMMRSLFDFSIFGTSVLAVVLSLFTALVVIHLLKRVLK